MTGLRARLPFSGGSVEGEAEHVARAVEIDRDLAAQQLDWVAKLRAQGIKAAHPDDGWVDRERNSVRLEYPQFNDGLAEGDLLALGWPWSGYRIVRVIGRDDSVDARLIPHARPWRWYFEAADVEGQHPPSQT